jgi:hypothetical protein
MFCVKVDPIMKHVDYMHSNIYDVMHVNSKLLHIMCLTAPKKSRNQHGRKLGCAFQPAAEPHGRAGKGCKALHAAFGLDMQPIFTPDPERGLAAGALVTVTGS